MCDPVQELRNAGSSFEDGVRDVGSSIDDAIIEPIGDGLANLDDFVNETVPGGWAGVILIAGGVYYAPEIGAYFSSIGAPLTAAEASAVVNAEVAAGTMTAAEAEAAYLAAAETAGATNAAAGYGATAAETAAASKGMLDGLTFKQALDGVRAGLLVNSLTGDPLGLAGDQPNGGGGGSTGFSIVPIPSDWQSPTYSAPSAPIDLSSIFSTQDMLGGTQWQGLQTQQPNISFNDIFAAGQQQTPMGTPVDINQIVSSILGQAATSQKPA